MKLSDHIKYCQEMMNKFGDHEITRSQTGSGVQYKPVEIKLELYKSGWLRKRTVTEDEEIIIKKRVNLYKMAIEEDTE